MYVPRGGALRCYAALQITVVMGCVCNDIILSWQAMSIVLSFLREAGDCRAIFKRILRTYTASELIFIATDMRFVVD